MIDSHIHLEQYPAEEIDGLIEDWSRCGIERIVAVSTSLASSYRTLELKQRYPNFIYAAVGYHPEQPLPPELEVIELLSLIKKERALISAIGEVGLPHYTLSDPSNVPTGYIELLDTFLKWGKTEKLPILLHAVHDKAEPVLHQLKKHDITKAHFHWLKAPCNVVEQISSAGYYISVTPEVCYRVRDQQLARLIPLSQLLLETDGPWNYSGIFANERTTPKLLYPTAAKVAQLKDTSFDQLLELCKRNIHRLFDYTRK